MVFGLSGGSNSATGRPDLGLTMEADYYGNQAIVRGFSLVDGRVTIFFEAFLCVLIIITRVCFDPLSGSSIDMQATPSNVG